MSKHLEENNLIARWMDGRLSEEEKKQLEESGELDALRTVIDDIDTWKVKPFDTEAKLAELQNRKGEVVNINRRRSWLRVAASVAILLSCGLVWYMMSGGGTIVSTQIAEHKSIELPKGSTVELDASSTLTYDEKNWNNIRSLTLEGQAFFDVTSGTAFEVNTPTAKVAVLGTQFNIKAEQERFSVLCYEGKIEVSYYGNTEIIIKGQSVVIESGKLLKSEHQKTNPDWLNGSSSYEKTPFLEVIADVQRYYDVSINLPESYTSLLFTGTIYHNDLERTLNTIFTSMEIKYSLKGNKVIFE